MTLCCGKELSCGALAVSLACTHKMSEELSPPPSVVKTKNRQTKTSPEHCWKLPGGQHCPGFCKEMHQVTGRREALRLSGREGVGFLGSSTRAELRRIGVTSSHREEFSRYKQGGSMALCGVFLTGNRSLPLCVPSNILGSPADTRLLTALVLPITSWEWLPRACVQILPLPAALTVL